MANSMRSLFDRLQSLVLQATSILQELQHTLTDDAPASPPIAIPSPVAEATAPASPPAGPPSPASATPLPAPPVKPASPPDDSRSYVTTNILSTIWMNREDEPGEDRPYDLAFSYDWAPKPYRGIGRDIRGAALPCLYPRGTVVDLFRGTRSCLGVPVIDVGPWNVDDDYITAGTRPQAETGTDRTGRHTNRAGLDLTPLTYSELTGLPVETCYRKSPSCTVDRIVLRIPRGAQDNLFSPHFSQHEFERSGLAEQNGIDNSIPDELLPNARRLALEVLEPIRTCLGGPLSIRSGYRCPDLNRLLANASPTSAHTRALAADLRRSTAIWTAMMQAWNNGTLRQALIQIESDHYHVALLETGTTHVKLLRTERTAWETEASQPAAPAPAPTAPDQR